MMEGMRQALATDMSSLLFQDFAAACAAGVSFRPPNSMAGNSAAPVSASITAPGEILAFTAGSSTGLPDASIQNPDRSGRSAPAASEPRPHVTQASTASAPPRTPR